MGGGGLTPPGTPLQQLLDDGLLGPRLLGPLLATVAESVAALHAQGETHGAVTAHTVWLTDDLEPRLSEASGATTDPADDVLALGLLLARGLLGEASTSASSARERLSEAPGPPHLREAAAAALDPNPQRRPTAAALATSLRAEPPREPPRAARTLGDRVGPYELVGREGVEFVGRTADGHEHVVKLLPPADRPRQAQRFAREAGALAKLADHPNLVGLRAFERLPDGQAYLALDRVDGDDLATACAAGPLPIERALKIGADVATALTHAHLHGVVHRDLTPHNVWLRADDDRALLTGFGLAFDDDAPRLTQSREILGSLGYQAPEQAQGTRVGPPADVFALGVVLYEALTGLRPFAGGSFLDLLEELLRTDPLPARHHRPDIGPDLDALLLRALEKDPALRPTAAELARDLSILVAGDQPLPTPGPDRGPARPAWVAAGLLILVLLGLGAQRQVALRAWEREASEALSRADAALAEWQAASLSLHFGPGPLPETEPLHQARAALAHLGARTEAERSDQGARVAERSTQLETALALARVDAHLARGEPQAARAQLERVPAGPERTVRQAVITAQQGPAAVDALVRLGENLKRTPDAYIRVRLLAARLALEGSKPDRARAILTATPPPPAPLRPVARRLLAAFEERLARAALEAGDGAQAAAHLAEALSVSGAPVRPNAWWLEHLTRPGADPVLGTDLLHALQDRLPTAELPPRAAAVELALARQLFASASPDLPRLFRALERAYALDPLLDIPPALVAFCARLARRVRPGQTGLSLRALILTVRSGRAIASSPAALVTLWRSQALANTPTDDVLRYVRAAALTAWLRAGRARDGERPKLGAQVEAWLDACLLGDALRGAARRDAQRRRAERGWLSR